MVLNVLKYSEITNNTKLSEVKAEELERRRILNV
jgi:hypothetical protein